MLGRVWYIPVDVSVRDPESMFCVTDRGCCVASFLRDVRTSLRSGAEWSASWLWVFVPIERQ